MYTQILAKAKSIRIFLKFWRCWGQQVHNFFFLKKWAYMGCFNTNLRLKPIFRIFLKSCRILSLFHIKITGSVTQSLDQDRGWCYLHLSILFLYIHSLLLLENKKLLWSLFSSANYTTEHCSIIYVYMLQGYSSVRIGFNMIKKCHKLSPCYF